MDDRLDPRIPVVADLLRRFERPRSYAGDYEADFARRVLAALADVALWVVVWEMPYEDGGFDSVWSSEAAAREEADRLNAADGIGQRFSVERVRFNTSR